jgi:hypothetical protein
MILDHIDNLELSDDEANEHIYAQSALARLAEGLFWIYWDVKDKEKYARQRSRKNDPLFSIGGDDIGNPPFVRSFGL